MEQQCVICDGNEYLVLACNSDLHKLCLQCTRNWLLSKTSEADSFNYQCPLYNDCKSEFDPGLVYDIFNQTQNMSPKITVAMIQYIEMNSAVKENKKISCPNCTFFYTEDTQDDAGFMELFPYCPMCKASFCLSCGHALGRHSYRDHVCSADACPKQKVRHELEEILTEAVTSRCTNPECELARVGAPLGTKGEDECNVIKCGTCQYLYCYICGKDLGPRSIAAHEGFPHANDAISGVPECWLFDDDDDEAGKTTGEALNRRKLHRLAGYFDSLPMSKEDKHALVTQNGDILGQLQGKIAEFIANGPSKDCVIL